MLSFDPGVVVSWGPRRCHTDTERDGEGDQDTLSEMQHTVVSVLPVWRPDMSLVTDFDARLKFEIDMVQWVG